MTTLPILDLSRTNRAVESDIRRAIERVIESSRYLKGAATHAFEEAWAAYCGAPYCLGVANGTDALQLLLEALGTRAGEVIIAPNAGGYATTAALAAGATPVYADIDPVSHVLSLDRAIAMLTPATRAIVATHLYGNQVDVPALRRMLAAAGRPDVRIVEDCAQAHGLETPAGRVGSLGDAAAFSFYPTKNLGALGDAGAITCTDRGLRDELVALHQYGWHERYHVARAHGRNSRIDEIQAAALLAKLPHLDAWTEQRREICRRYRAAAADLAWVTGAVPTVAHLMVLETADRGQVRAALDEASIGSDVHYPVLDCDQPAWRHAGFRCDDLRAAKAAVGRILTVPCFPGMTNEEVRRTCAVLRGVCA